MRAPRRRFFDLWSLVYDAPLLQRAAYRPVHDAVLRALVRRSPEAILDLACGTGQLASRLSDRFPHSRVVGCDFSAGMLQRAARRGANVGWVRGDATCLPFADESFDTVTCTEAFHWFPDQEAALAEIHRVLAPGGWALIALVHPRSTWLSEIASLGSRLLGQPFYWPTSAVFRRALSAAGFDTLSQRSARRVFAALLPAVLSVAQKPRSNTGCSFPRARGGTIRHLKVGAAARGAGPRPRKRGRPSSSKRPRPSRKSATILAERRMTHGDLDEAARLS